MINTYNNKQNGAATMNIIINSLKEVKNEGTTRLTNRIILEKNGYITHLGYGKFELSSKGQMALRIGA